MKPPTIIGLDLSLNASAAVRLGPGWKPGNWKLESQVFVPPKFPETDKNAAAARRLEWVTAELRWWIIGGNNYFPKDLRVYVEDYAFAASVTSARAVAELVGCVKLTLWRSGILVQPVAMNTARKALLGHVPTKKTSGIAVKDYVNEKLARMGAKFDTMDEGDAFVIANAARSLLGLSHVGVGR